jgi:hypothetical protein
MKMIKGNHKAAYESIAHLVTYRAMPTATVTMNHLIRGWTIFFNIVISTSIQCAA